MSTVARDDPRLLLLAELVASSPHNLVSRHDLEGDRLFRRHLLESLHIGQLMPCQPGERWMDLGTGGGIPGLILACQYPDIRWTLVDSVQKKAHAVENFAGRMGLENVEVVGGRAEDLAWSSGLRGAMDGVVARAVAPLVVLVELARGFVGDGGMLAAVKGRECAAELAEAEWALSQLRWGDVHSRPVTGTVGHTVLVTMAARGPAPDWVPRRAGVPQRRPLREKRSAEG